MKIIHTASILTSSVRLSLCKMPNAGNRIGNVNSDYKNFTNISQVVVLFGEDLQPSPGIQGAVST